MPMSRSFATTWKFLQDSIPVTSIWEALSPAQVFEAELDENIRRVDIPWPDRTAALASLHELYKTENPRSNRPAKPHRPYSKPRAARSRRNSAHEVPRPLSPAK